MKTTVVFAISTVFSLSMAGEVKPYVNRHSTNLPATENPSW
jgi:hypothetical protein